MRRLSILLISAAMALTLIALAVVTGASAAVQVPDAQGQKGSGQQITLERGGNAAFRDELSGAENREDFEPQIVGGTPVPKGKYPFMAFLEISGADGNIYQCGGTLIDPDSVLTAAHCIVDTNAQKVDLVVGRTVLSQNQGQVRFATTADIHPSYNPQRIGPYDAAVLKLNRAVTGIKPLKLATARQNKLETPGRLLRVAGWGDTSEGGNPSVRMLEVSVPVVSDSAAKRAYSSDYFPSLMVAAGAKGKSSCQGDSGGPLFNPGPTSTQVGIVSFANGCARAGFPTVYTEANNPGISTFIRNGAK